MSQTKTKEQFSVWINQCWECGDISNIVVKNAERVDIMNDIEDKIRFKYLNESDGWNDSYKEIIKPKEIKGELITEGNITINLRKYKIFAKVERHKCCKCGGNY